MKPSKKPEITTFHHVLLGWKGLRQGSINLEPENGRTFKAEVNNGKNSRNRLHVELGHMDAAENRITDALHMVFLANAIHTERHKDEKPVSPLRVFRKGVLYKVPSYFFSIKINGPEDAARYGTPKDLTGTYYYKEYQDEDKPGKKIAEYVRSGNRLIPVKSCKPEPS